MGLHGLEDLRFDRGEGGHGLVLLHEERNRCPAAGAPCPARKGRAPAPSSLPGPPDGEHRPSFERATSRMDSTRESLWCGVAGASMPVSSEGRRPVQSLRWYPKPPCRGKQLLFCKIVARSGRA